MPDKRRKHFLKNKEARSLLRKASERLRMNLESLFKERMDIEVIETESDEIILVNGRPVMIKTGDTVYPTLKFEEYLRLAPKVIVDMGAVPFVCKGANIMAPGVRRIEGTFDVASIVAVVDEKHGKPIALGEILYDSEEARKIKQGILVKNLFYVGDRIWNLLKELTSDSHKDVSLSEANRML
jgi:PUA-domain protein